MIILYSYHVIASKLHACTCIKRLDSKAFYIVYSVLIMDIPYVLHNEHRERKWMTCAGPY